MSDIPIIRMPPKESAQPTREDKLKEESTGAQAHEKKPIQSDRDETRGESEKTRQGAKRDLEQEEPDRDREEQETPEPTREEHEDQSREKKSPVSEPETREQKTPARSRTQLIPLESRSHDVVEKPSDNLPASGAAPGLLTPPKVRSTQLIPPSPAEQSNALLLHFVRTKIKDRRPRATTGTIPIKKEGDVMVVSKDELLPSVFKKLSTEGFLSAPVEDFWGRYCGFITMFDLVKFTNGLFWGQSEEAWSQFFEAENRFAETRVSDILRIPDQWNRDPFHPVYRDFSLFSCLETMALTGVHRLGVVDPTTKRIAGIQTQSALISELRQTKHLMGPALLMLRVKDFLPTLNWVIHTIKETEPAINAFNEMEAKKVHGLAVVDDNGFLVDSISMRDLRGVGDAGQSFWRLYQPIKEFKSYVRLRFPKQAPPTHFSSRRAPTMPLYVTKEDTFETVLEQMNDGCIHRIFVCTENEQGNPTPTHVISQRDMLVQVLNYMTY